MNFHQAEPSFDGRHMLPIAGRRNPGLEVVEIFFGSFPKRDGWTTFRGGAPYVLQFLPRPASHFAEVTQGENLMHLQPVLRCKNPDCPLPAAAPIRLPYSNPTKMGEQPPNWPSEGWQLRLICHGCDHWYVYEKQDVEWKDLMHVWADIGLDFWCVELQCGEPNCDSCTKWYATDANALSESEIIEFVMRADPIPICGNGHSLGASGIKAQSATKVTAL
jgi:hypothetical protein